MKESGSAAESFGKVSTLAMAAAGAAAVAFAFKAASAFVDYGKEVMKLSRITGESIDTASKWDYAAKMSGVSADTLGNGVKFMQKNMAAGNEEFGKLGISVKDNNGKLRDSHDVFLETADAISKLGAGAERNAAILKIFGRAGLDLGPMLSKGRDAIIALEGEAQKYGLVLTQDNVNAIKQNVQAHREQDAAMQGLQVRVGQFVLPALTAMTQATADFTEAIGNTPGPVLAVGGALLGVVTFGPKVVSAFMEMKASGELMSGAMSGVAIVGIGVVLKGMHDIEEQSKKMQTQLSAGIDWSNYGKAAQGLNAEGAAVDQLGEAWNNMSAAEKLSNPGAWKIYNDAAAQLEEDGKHFDETTKRIKDLASALGLPGPEAQKMADSMAVDLTKIGPEKYTPIFKAVQDGSLSVKDAQTQLEAAVRATNSSAEDQAADLEALRKATKELNDAEQALLNPQFAMIDALDKQKDAAAKSAKARWDQAAAEAEYQKAVAWYGPNSQAAFWALNKLNDAKATTLKADQDAVKANIDLDAAIRNLETGFKDGSVTMEETKAKLDEWVASGRLTQEQADYISFSLLVTKGKADEYGTAMDNATGKTLTADTSQAQAAIDSVNKAIEAYLANAAKVGLDAAQFGTAAARASDPNNPANHASGGVLDMGWNMVGEEGPELAYNDGRNVHVKTTAQTRGILVPHAATSAGRSSPSTSDQRGGFNHYGDINIGHATERTAADIAWEQRKMALHGGVR